LRLSLWLLPPMKLLTVWKVPKAPNLSDLTNLYLRNIKVA